MSPAQPLSTRPTRLALLGLALLGLAFLMAACADSDVGVPCAPPVAELKASELVVDGNARDCSERLCVAIGSDQGTSALCSAPCSEDDDCPGPSARCAGGFACAVPQIIGPLTCRRLCVCRSAANLDRNNALCGK